jgi:hypothetical protein
MKLTNPLFYPLAVLAGGITLVIGVRFAKLPSVIMLPLAAGIATASASYLKFRQPVSLGLDNSQLETELQSALNSAKVVAAKAQELRQEAAKLLTDALQMQLLIDVQYACDGATELPDKIDHLIRRFQGADSLLSVSELQQQLADVQKRLNSSSGIAKEHLQQLAQSLERNIELAKQGQDVRQAQLISLSKLIQDSAGVLQELQNKLRHADLTDTTQTMELQQFCNELSSFQQNVDFLVSK